MAAEWTVTSMSAVAKFFGVSVETVRREWQARGMPGTDRSYQLDEIARWRIQRAQNQHQRPEPSDGDKSRDHLECEKLELENGRRRLKLAKESGDLVERDAAKAQIERLFHRVRARLEATPEELASSLPPEIRADYLADARQKIGLILLEMESWGEA